MCRRLLICRTPSVRANCWATRAAHASAAWSTARISSAVHTRGRRSSAQHTPTGSSAWSRTGKPRNARTPNSRSGVSSGTRRSCATSSTTTGSPVVRTCPATVLSSGTSGRVPHPDRSPTPPPPPGGRGAGEGGGGPRRYRGRLGGQRGGMVGGALGQRAAAEVDGGRLPLPGRHPRPPVLLGPVPPHHPPSLMFRIGQIGAKKVGTSIARVILHVAGFDELSAGTLYALLRLRVDVFVVEQRCPYPELDGRDTEPGTRHVWLASEGGTEGGTAGGTPLA